MQAEKGRIFIGRLPHKADLLESLAEVCKENNINMGVFSVIGAVTSANMGYYKQKEQKYVDCIDLDKKLEITACIGNISLKDEEIFVHAHITLADFEGQCYGGHLMLGTKIFAAEYHIQELTGDQLIRQFDPPTGLSLWP
ncbi:MAG: DNA-binding protein [Candidatus Zapsychrus exili]|nr:DNA-binding protein [Candidatus Zapsychrus exili]